MGPARLHEHRAIDHGYATTSYRSQGRTVDSIYALASAAEARRGLYVDVTDVTRAREDVTIAYGKDAVQDFGDLLMRAQRDGGKVLVRDVERNVNLRIEREEKRKRLRNVALEPWSKDKSRRSIVARSPRSIAATAEAWAGELPHPSDSPHWL